MNKLVKAVLAFVFLAIVGCTPTWKPVGTAAYVQGDSFSIVLPRGWLQLEGMDKKSVIASTDGPFLQSFVASHKDIRTAFKATKAEVSADTLTYELMEYYIAESKANSGDQTVDVESKEAVEIAGEDGFKVVFLYKNQEGLRFKKVIYGCMNDSRLYTLSYHAPVLYYFDKNLPDFEASVKTFRFL